MAFKYIELFAGIGGFRSALDPLGGECVFASEIDPFATRVLNSKHFGVPQNRERIFIVCERDAEHAEWNVNGNDVVAKAKRRIKALGVRTFNFDWPMDDAVTTRLRDVLEANVDEKYYLSEKKTARLIAHLNDRGQIADSDDCEMIGHVDGINGHDICRRVYTPTGVAPTGVAPTIPTGASTSGNTTPKVVIEEPRWNNQAPKVLEPQEINEGDGLSYSLTASYGHKTQHVLEPYTVIQKTHSASTTVKYDETGTLQAARLDKVPQVVLEHKAEINTTPPELCGYCGDSPDPDVMCAKCWAEMEARSDEEVRAYPRYRIRKLTPLECWRLQGFTDEQHANVAAAGISDSQRYKQAGNAVTVNVISAIGKRMIPLLDVNKPQEVAI